MNMKMKAHYDSLPLLVLEYHHPHNDDKKVNCLALVASSSSLPDDSSRADPIAEYMALMATQRHARGPIADELRASAKKHLESAGWSFWMKLKSNGREELRYKAPTGRSYVSLHTACVAAFSSQSQSHHHHQILKDNKTIASSSSADKKRRKPITCLTNKRSTKTKRRRISQLITNDDAAAVIEKCTTTTSSRNKKRFELVDGTSCLIEKQSTTTLIKKRKHKVNDADDVNKQSQARVLRPRGATRDKSPVDRRSRTLLSVLFDKKILVPGKDRKVTCRATRDGPPLKQGSITGDGVRCTCCNKAFTVAEFEAHSDTTSCCWGWGGRVFLRDGRSLAQCLLQLRSRDSDRYYKQRQITGVRLKSKCMDLDGDTVCSICHDGGDLLLCDHCPSTFHHECLGLPGVPEGDGDWSCPSCRCAICDRSDFVDPDDSRVTTDRTIRYCEQCEREFHVGCINGVPAQGEEGAEVPPYWVCSEECSKVFHHLQGLVGKPPVATEMEGVSLVVLRSRSSTADDGGSEEVAAAQQHGKLCAALDGLHECFVTLIEPRTQSDLSEDMVFNRESELRRLHFRGYYVVGLEKGGELVTVATLRVYGDKVAELPLVGTRFAHRRQGLCRLLVNQVERMLAALGVHRLVLPSVPELLQTWTGPSFGFKPMTHSDRLQIVGHTILCFQGTTMCHKLLQPLSH